MTAMAVDQNLIRELINDGLSQRSAVSIATAIATAKAADAADVALPPIAGAGDASKVVAVKADHTGYELTTPDSGGSSPIAHVKVPIAFDTAGLTAGVDVYTPTIGDVLLDAWIEVTTAWDGTTPLADLGTFVGTTGGMKAYWSLTQDLTRAVDDGATGNGLTNFADNGTPTTTSLSQAEQLISTGVGGVLSGGIPVNLVPATFTAVDPLKIVVSQTGAAGGADPGSLQGVAVVHVLILNA